MLWDYDSIKMLMLLIHLSQKQLLENIARALYDN